MSLCEQVSRTPADLPEVGDIVSSVLYLFLDSFSVWFYFLVRSTWEDIRSF